MKTCTVHEESQLCADTLDGNVDNEYYIYMVWLDEIMTLFQHVALDQQGRVINELHTLCSVIVPDLRIYTP